MFRNGLNSRTGLGMDGENLRRSLDRHATRTAERAAAGEDAPHPDKLGYGTVLSARGNVYGDVRRVDPVTVAKRRARNKAARKARRVTR